MTENQAINKAVKNSNRDGEEWLVIEEFPCDFKVCKDEDLYMFYSGLENHVVFSNLE